MSLVAKRLAKANEKQAESKTVHVESSGITEKKEKNTFKQELELFNAAIESDLAQLKKFSTIEDKDEYKAQAIEKNNYLDYVRRYIASGDNYPNLTFTWVVIWLVDLCRWNQALEFLPYLVRQQQHLPPVFNTKDWSTFFIDQLYDAGAKELKAQSENAEAVQKSQIIKVFNLLIDLVESAESEKPLINDIVLGKLYAMGAKLEYCLHNYGNALEHCLHALKANDGAGVKKLAKDIAKKINKDVDI